jgi:predicted amidohydrolase
VVGYPEKVDVTTSWPASPEYYNSTIMINRDGETILNYRKRHVKDDSIWALENQNGFGDKWIPGFGPTSVAISSDIAQV